MNRYVTVGLTVLAGAALFEVALIPGLVIGAAMLRRNTYPERVGVCSRWSSRLSAD